MAYQDLPESDFKAALLGAGLPDLLATLLAESDVGASKGGLFDNSRHSLAERGQIIALVSEAILAGARQDRAYATISLSHRTLQRWCRFQKANARISEVGCTTGTESG